jgi:hypothetical protein
MNVTDIIPLPYRLLLLAGVVVGTFTTGYVYGIEHEQRKQQSDQEKAAAQAVKIVTKQGIVTTQVETQYVHDVQLIKEKGDAIIREVPTYVPVDACPVPAAVGVLVNAAEAGSALPPPTPKPDDSGTTAAAVAEWAVATVTVCKQNSEQLTALQQWVRQQEETTNGIQ